MSILKDISLAAAALLVGTSTSFAADLARRPPIVPAAPAISVWNGFYVGANGGYGWTENRFDSVAFTSKLNGGFAGGQLGYNWQLPSNWVVGVEADAQWADMSRSNVVTLGGATFSLDQQLQNFGTFRARAGYAFNNVLLYGTGGWAWANEVGTANATVPGFIASARISNFLSGYAAGAGIEWAFLPNASAKFEYLHLGFDTNNYMGVLPVKTDVDTIKIGVNYLFH